MPDRLFHLLERLARVDSALRLAESRTGTRTADDGDGVRRLRLAKARVKALIHAVLARRSGVALA